MATGDSTRTVASKRERFEEALHRLEFTLRSAPTGAPSRPGLEATLDRIGRTRERTIELRPGAHVFEGKREGYCSKLVEVVMQASAGAPVEVRIVCDERS